MGLRRETRVIHGHKRAFLLTGPRLGTAPVLWLIHGIGDSSRTWEEVLPLLGDGYTVVAPDLLGHGASDKPRADYSVGGFANGMRDLMIVLGVERATVVGHSLGGGVALQFAYQYPELVERLVLVASGGLGAEVHPVLRAAALPGTSALIGVSSHPMLRVPALTAAKLAARVGLLDPADVEETGYVWEALRDGSTRAAFLRTLRSVIDVRGQAVTSRDRLYLTAAIPTLLIWGARDPILPVAHARVAADALPGAQLEVVARAGHLPHRSRPQGFADSLLGFLASTVPAHHDPSVWRDLLLGADPEATAVTSLAVLPAS
jgi:pimeloyl-ACP methyl ester carboxylesterase